MKRPIFLILLSILTTNVLFCQEKNMIDGVVWIVGDASILRSDVEQERIRAQYEGNKIEGDPYCIIPEQIALQKLFIHQAKIDSINYNAAQVETQVNAQISYYLREIGSKEKLEEYFKKSVSEIKEELRTAISEQSLVQQVQQSLVSDIKITPSDVRKFYSSCNPDSLPVIPAQIEVQIITIEPEIPAEVIEATKERLREYADRVNKGEADFSMLARLYSDDTESAKKGGELGFVGRGTLVPEFADAAFALSEPGKVSRVIETEFGFHIIQLIEKRDERINCRHILLRPRVTSDVKANALLKLDTIADNIRNNKITFENAVEQYSSDKNTKMNDGILTNSNSGSSKFEFQDLPSEIAKIAYDLKPGEISQPFSMFSEELGREIYAIVKIKSKTENHTANLKDDFQTLKVICENKMRQDVIENWIKKKIKETYIFISPEWRDCKFQYSEWLSK